MNLIFGSVFLFILISPGLIFRFSYLQGSYAKLNFKVSAIDEVFWALVPALFFQILGVWIIEHWLGIPIRLDVIYYLITANGAADFKVIDNGLMPFLGYTTVVIVVSVATGVITRFIIRGFRMDRKWKFLRFGNEWYYLLSGEMSAEFRNTNIFNQRKPELIIQVDTLVSSSEGNIIYSGTLENYFLSKENGLDRIYLSNVYRRKLKDDLGNDQPNVGYLERHLDSRYYAMPGEILVLPYDKVINLNVTYYNLNHYLVEENTSMNESDTQ
jgi:hypothetical protein